MEFKPLRPRPMTAGKIDMTRSVQVNEAGSDRSRKRPGTGLIHAWIVAAACHNRRYPKAAPLRLEVEHAEPFARHGIGWCNEEHPLNTELPPAPQESDDHKAAKAMRDQDRSRMPNDGGREAIFPCIRRRAMPVVLFDENGTRVHVDPPVLPVANRRAVEAGNQQRLGSGHVSPPGSVLWRDQWRVGGPPHAQASAALIGCAVVNLRRSMANRDVTVLRRSRAVRCL